MDAHIEEAIDFALTSGLIKFNTQFKLTHAPFCLSPYLIEKELLESLKTSTPLFNELMINVGEDKDFIQEHLEPAAITD